MKSRIKIKLLILLIFQLITFGFSFYIYHNITLLSYINITFYISAALLLISLIIYTIRTGFYDVMSKSLNRAFTRGKDSRSWDEIPGLSELVTINQKPLFFYGLINGLFMGIALFIYYL